MSLQEIFARRRLRAAQPDRTVRMRRQFDHLEQMFLPSGAAAQPNRYEAKVSPGIDLFGTARMKEYQTFTQQAAAGIIENFHTIVPAGRIRHYLASEYLDDDATGHQLFPALNFVNASFRTAIESSTTYIGDAAPDAETLRRSISNILVPPGGAFGWVSGGLAALAQSTALFLWIEMPLGEYILVP